jgi:hypothetical protein
MAQDKIPESRAYEIPPESCARVGEVKTLVDNKCLRLDSSGVFVPIINLEEYKKTLYFDGLTFNQPDQEGRSSSERAALLALSLRDFAQQNPKYSSLGFDVVQRIGSTTTIDAVLIVDKDKLLSDVSSNYLLFAKAYNDHIAKLQ